MVGFLNPEGTFPHLSIHVQSDFRQVDENGETYEPEEFAPADTSNIGYEIVDADYFESDDDHSFAFEEIKAMVDYDDDPDYPFLDDYLKHEALEEAAASAETLEISESTTCGRRVGGERHHYLPILEAERKYFRSLRNAGAHGSEPKWQTYAGGGKRGRLSIRLTVPIEFSVAPATFDELEADLWFREWMKEQEAQAYIQEVLEEFVDFGHEPLKLAA